MCSEEEAEAGEGAGGLDCCCGGDCFEYSPANPAGAGGEADMRGLAAGAVCDAAEPELQRNARGNG